MGWIMDDGVPAVEKSGETLYPHLSGVGDVGNERGRMDKKAVGVSFFLLLGIFVSRDWTA